MSSAHRDRSVVWPGGPSLCGPHAVSSFATCPQMHAFAHELHLRPVISKPAPAIGTLIHAGLAYYYAAPLPIKPDWYVYSSGAEAIRILGAATPDFMEDALRVFTQYVEQDTRPWAPVLVEHQFVVDFDGMPYSARIDLLAYEGNDLVLIDHKSTSRITSSMGAGYASDIQMLTGLAQCRAAGYDVKRVVINALSRERPFAKFQRFDVPINQYVFERFPMDVRYHLKVLKDVRLNYPNLYNRPRNLAACMGKYGPCDFMPLCTGVPNAEHSFHVPSEYQHGREVKGT